MIKSLLIALCMAAAPAGAVAQVTSQRIVESDGTRSLVHEVLIDAPRAEVWTAVSTADGWRSWAAPVMWADPVDVEVIEGSYDPNASPGHPQTIRQRILVRVPGRMIAWRTIKAPRLSRLRDFLAGQERARARRRRTSPDPGPPHHGRLCRHGVGAPAARLLRRRQFRIARPSAPAVPGRTAGLAPGAVPPKPVLNAERPDAGQCLTSRPGSCSGHRALRRMSWRGM